MILLYIYSWKSLVERPTERIICLGLEQWFSVGWICPREAVGLITFLIVTTARKECYQLLVSRDAANQLGIHRTALSPSLFLPMLPQQRTRWSPCQQYWDSWARGYLVLLPVLLQLLEGRTDSSLCNTPEHLSVAAALWSHHWRYKRGNFLANHIPQRT